MNLLLESEFESAMWSALESQYGLIGSTLYHYLILRSKVENIQKGRMKRLEKGATQRQLTSFLMKEWGLREGERVLFQGEEFTISLTGAFGVHKIVEDWHVQFTYRYARGQFEEVIEKEWESYVKEAKSKVRKLARQPFYEMALRQAYLDKINCAYEVGNRYDAVGIEDSLNFQGVEPVRLELQYERFLHPYYLQHNDATLVDENAVEDYLVAHLEELEEGLRLIGRQIVLERGRIDILARDKNHVPVIIEVKVATDTDLVWQQSYYMKEIKKEHGMNARFMVVAPKWEAHIMGMLLQNPDTEIKLFTPTVEQKKIQSLEIYKSYAS